MHALSTTSSIRLTRLIRLFCLGTLFLGACTPAYQGSSFAGGVVQTQAMAKHYGVIHDAALQTYLDSVVLRLVAAMQHGPRSSSIPTPQLEVLATQTPIAISPGGGFILVSKGLFLSLQNEAELAFVLAHELGHEKLGHLTQLQHQAPSEEDLLHWEYEADHYGIGLMAVAGYDPRPAIAGLIHSYRALARTLNVPLTAAQSSSHPDLQSRISALQDYITASGWQPPGTVDRREFRTLQLRLRAGTN